MQKVKIINQLKNSSPRPSLSYLDTNQQTKLVILISGREGKGKTHLASTLSQTEQVYLIDTEYRAQIVTSKFKNIKVVQAKNYKELKNAVDFIVNNESSGSIVIDSASDLQVFAEIEYLEHTYKNKVGMPWNWSEVWKLCNEIIDKIKHSNKFHLILTSRMKDEYINDKNTGNQIPRIYSTLPYKADIMLQFSDDSKLLITKNGFTNKRCEPLNTNLSLQEIIKILSQTNSNNLGEIKNDTNNRK